MRRSIIISAFILIAGCMHRGQAADLEQAFLAPPDSARPWVYWFWLNGNVSKEGITADLEAMQRVGLGGALWMWGGGLGAETDRPVRLLSPEWWELMRHTIREADRLGLKLNMTNGSGWSHSGGPWVSANHNMQNLKLAGEFHWNGPGRKDMAIDPGSMVRVLAYPVAGLVSSTAVDLTDKVDASGRLVWDVPQGAWNIYLFSHAATGDRPHPIRGDETGWECDKLNPEAVEENWRGFVPRILNECGPEARRVIRYVHVDSYEFGPTTWTAGLLETFRKRCGYDPSPYLPVVFGKVVDSPEVSARFLWDFKRLLADLFAEGIGGRFRDLAQAEGIKLTTEPHLIADVFDHVQYGGHVSNTFGNFLDARRTQHYAVNPPVGPEMHLAKAEASAACTYGLEDVVWAEAFTGVDHAHAWHENLDYLRTWGDMWLCEGINRFCFHCWPHSPWLDRKPGNTLGPWGIHFDRNNTWFEYATGYLAYLARCQHLLQQGHPVMDVCVFTGDGRVDQFPPHPELRASGYDYHGMTAEVLVKDLEFKDGWLVLPSGMRYRLLVTYDRSLRPQTLRKIARLVAAGATVMGEKPDDAPGLVGYPKSRDEVRALADEMWGTDIEAGKNGHTYGKGKVYLAKAGKADQSGKSGIQGPLLYLDCESELKVLNLARILPDFSYSNSGKEDGDNMLAYTHRRVNDADFYFVSNQAARPRREDCTFRIAGRSPELWDPVTGEIRDLPVYQENNGVTTIPMDFAPGQSFFIAFRKTARGGPVADDKVNFADLKPVVELTGAWQVSFDPRWGGPEKPVTFEELLDWTQRPEEGIRHYSGKATYHKTFDFPAGRQGRRIYLDLGQVKDLAEVRLNGRIPGIVWCVPWRIEITDAVRAGGNDLELVVVNQWVNRLIGDSALPQEKRFTWTTSNPYQPASPLLPSGLLGPVRVMAVDGK